MQHVRTADPYTALAELGLVSSEGGAATAAPAATLTIEDLDAAPADATALFTVCILAPEPSELCAA